ncbi:uncharacterized protein I303_107399 [Kwoniella dejecticola CBS 10117]|uniref:Uncharacterized protein n=1 Tax=Kwoniella dejecticola CBS 10117 TaxID=1296121 RepID=A0A1A5ZZL8_9TREE|nr:uncharacterized protein I303_06803 [Kwoniella dejecticola CBS 10117]OBR83242.1 hypothetical protein I303_06803 [Kwoniella dejecticola CBS 10117]
MPDRNCSQAASFDWNAPDSASGQAPSWHKWTDYQTLNRKAFTGLVSDILTNQQDAWLNDNCQGELVKAAYRTNSLVNTAKGDSNLVIDSTASPSQVILNHAVRNLCPLMKGSEIYTAWETQGFTNKYDQTDLENALDLLKK